MAQLALGVVGGAIGSYFGYPGIGFALGSAIGAVAFPADAGNHVEAPKLGDLKVSGSTYGQMIPIGYGTVRMPGNIVWLQYRDEVDEIEASGAKGGVGVFGGGSATTGYSVERYASWAQIFAEGPAEDLISLWADGKKIWDKGEDVELYNTEGFQFRFYKGDDTQVPDSLIEADRGEGNVPAYRHRAYIVFEDIPLSRFGGRIPNITAEITFKKTNVYPAAPFEFEASDWNSLSIKSLTFDPDTRKIFGFGEDADGDDALGVWQIRNDSSNMILQRKYSDIFTGTWDSYSSQSPSVPVAVGRIFHCPANLATNPSYPEGFLFLHSELLYDFAGFDYYDMARLDAATLNFIDRDVQSTPDWHVMESEGGAVAKAFVRDQSTLQLIPYYHLYSSGDLLSGLNLYDCATGNQIDRWDINLGRAWVNGKAQIDRSHAYGFATNAIGNFLSIYEVSVFRIGSPVQGTIAWDSEYRLLQNWGFDGSPLDTLIEDVDGLASSPDFYGGFYDETTDRIYFTFDFELASGGTSTYFVKFNPNADMAVDGYLKIAGLKRQITQGSRGTWSLDGTVLFGINDTSNSPSITGSRVIKVDLNTMEIVQDLNGSRFSPDQDFTSVNTVQLYDPVTHSITTFGSNKVMAFYERGDGEGETLASVVTDLSVNHAGLSASDIDVSELTSDIVRGYAVTRQGPTKRSIEQLQIGYFFDPVQVDGKVKFLKRGRAASYTIDPDDMKSPKGDGDFWVPQRAEDVEIPHEVSFTFMDIDRDYQESTAIEKRTKEPTPTQQSQEKLSLQVPIVFNHTEARAITERHLYRSWIERTQFKTKIPWKYLTNHPAEVGSVTFDSGLAYTVRMVGMSINADLTLDATFVSEDVATYTASGKTGDGGVVPENNVETWDEGRMFIIDSPLLQDADTGSFGADTTYYLSMGAQNVGIPFTGGVVFRSQDGQTWDTRVTASGSTPHGTATNALGNVDAPFVWDDVNTLTILVTAGSDLITSSTDTAVLNGANAAALYNDNGVEIIQWVNAVDNGDGTITLSRLLRGRRGSDVFTGIHAVGDTFVVLSSAYTNKDSVQFSLLNSVLYFLGLSTGEVFDPGRQRAETLIGRASYPYAPMHVARSDDFVSSPAGITFSWVRRTRIGGENIKGDSSVIDLESGGFKVQIMSAESDPAASPVGTVLRTLTAAKGETSVLYEDADITTDFGSPVPATIYARVLEVSSDTGDGFWYEWKLVDGEDEGTRVHAGEKDTILW